jgi:hypothetical protein
MLAALNDPDPVRVRHQFERAVAPGVEFLDPSVATHGIDEFETNVRRVQGSLPGANYSRTSGVDSHHQLHRYSWQISLGGLALLSGFDVTEVDEHGQVTRVLGFFGPLPDAD